MQRRSKVPWLCSLHFPNCWSLPALAKQKVLAISYHLPSPPLCCPFHIRLQHRAGSGPSYSQSSISMQTLQPWPQSISFYIQSGELFLWALQCPRSYRLVILQSLYCISVDGTSSAKTDLGEKLTDGFVVHMDPHMRNPKIINSLFSPFLHLQETLDQVMRHWHATSSDLYIFTLDITEGNRGDLVKLPRPYP